MTSKECLFSGEMLAMTLALGGVKTPPFPDRYRFNDNPPPVGTGDWVLKEMEGQGGCSAAMWFSSRNGDGASIGFKGLSQPSAKPTRETYRTWFPEVQIYRGNDGQRPVSLFTPPVDPPFIETSFGFSDNVIREVKSPGSPQCRFYTHPDYPHRCGFKKFEPGVRDALQLLVRFVDAADPQAFPFSHPWAQKQLLELKQVLAERSPPLPKFREVKQTKSAEDGAFSL